MFYLTTLSTHFVYVYIASDTSIHPYMHTHEYRNTDTFTNRHICANTQTEQEIIQTDQGNSQKQKSREVIKSFVLKIFRLYKIII